MRQLASALLASLLLAGCASTPSPDPGLKLYVFDCGSISFDNIAAFGLGNDESPVRELFVPCYLVDHGGTYLLWDAGLPLNLVGAGEQVMQTGAKLIYERSLLDQMQTLGLTPADIDLVAFSHMHFDHVGAAHEFLQSTLLIQDTEYEAAFLHAQDNPVFDPTLYERFSGASRLVLSGDHDVFGDGTVRIISAPGHTPGHQVLQLELANLGTLILSGDLYHFAESRRMRRTPEFNTNRAQTLKSMDKIEALIKANDATFWIEHERALADTLNLAPAYYD